MFAAVRRICTVLAIVICAITSALASATDSEAIRIGVLTKGNEALTMQRWPATAEYLHNHIPSHEFKIVPLDFHQIDTAVKERDIDFLLTNPASFVEMESRYGVSAVLTMNRRLNEHDSATEFAGVVLTRAGRTDLQAYPDLIDKSFMAVDQTSFGGWAMAWRQMQLYNINPFSDLQSIAFAGSHEAVVQAVLDGKVDAGTIRTGVLERMAAAGRLSLDQLHVLPYEDSAHGQDEKNELPLLHSTIYYPEWPLASLSHNDKALVKQVVQAMLEMRPEDQSARNANIMGWAPSVNYLAVHNLMKDLRLAQYQHFGEVNLQDAIKQHWIWVVCIALALVVLAFFSLYVMRLNSRVGQINYEMKQEVEKKVAAQSELLAETEKVNKIIDNVLEGVVTIDAAGFIQTFNQAAEKIFGYRQVEVLGQNVKMLMPGSDAREHNSHLDKYVATKKTKIIGLGREVFGRRKGGEIFSLEIAVSEVMVHGQRMFIALMRDLTERKQAEQKIMRLVSAIRCAAEGIFIADVDGCIEYANPAYEEVTGYSQAELERRKPAAFEMAAKGDPCCVDLFETVQRGEPWNGEYASRRCNGDSYEEETTIAPVVDDKGAVICLVGVCRDVTEKLAREQRIQDLERFEAISKMAGGFAHDFNNLLSTIMGYTDIVLLDAEPDSALAEDMGHVMAAANRAKRLVQQLQDVSKQDYEEMLAFAPQKIITDVIGLLETMLPAGAVVNSDLEDDVGEICMPSQEFQQLVMNLAVNAINALPAEGGRIDISLDECDVGDDVSIEGLAPGSYIVLRVSDNGAGFDQLQRDKIFEANFSVHDSVVGNSVGLAAVQGIVNRHQGLVKVDSAPGQGAGFTVYLPQVQPGFLLHTNWAYSI